MFPAFGQRLTPPAAAPVISSDTYLPSLLKILGRVFADYHAASGQPAILLGHSAEAQTTLEVAATDTESFTAVMRLNGFVPCADADGWRHQAHPGYLIARIGGGNRAGD